MYRRLITLLIPVGVLAAAAGVGASSQDRSVLPPADPPARTPAPAAPELPLQILVFRAGPGPYAWAWPGRVAASFITDTPNDLEVIALAGRGGRPLEAPVEWSITPPEGFQVAPDADLTGGKLLVRLVRTQGNPSGGGGPLTLAVAARLEQDDAPPLDAAATLVQDARDRLRQEYVDLERTRIPERPELLDEAEFVRRYGKKYPDVRFEELNWSRRPEGDDRYPFILATEELVRTVQETRRLYGRALTVSSGFRNPVRQVQVHAEVEESHHQYGRAADLYVAPDSAPPTTGRSVATEQDWLFLAATALRAGGKWIEPMAACHVNTTGCHVHVDVRAEGAVSRLVRVAGVVADPAGYPVPGATVRLAGMAAVTNVRGRFLLKHVLTPQEALLQVEAPGRGITTESLVIATEGDPEVTVRIPADPLPSLIAHAEADLVTSETGEPVAVVRVFLRNVGLAPASQVRITMNGALGIAAPEPIVRIPPGEQPVVELRVPVDSPEVEGTALSLVLSAAYLTPQGGTRVQRLPVEAWILPAVPVPQPVAGSGPIEPEAPTGPDVGAAAGGAAVGGAAAAVAALARRRKPLRR